MSSFLYGLGRWAFRRRIAILVTWLTVLVLLGGLAAVGAKKFDESFSLPGTESRAVSNAVRPGPVSVRGGRSGCGRRSADDDRAPPAFAAIAPFLPVIPALRAVRAMVSGGSGTAAAVGLLLGWLLLAVSIIVLAVARRRMLPAPGSGVRPALVGSLLP